MTGICTYTSVLCSRWIPTSVGVGRVRGVDVSTAGLFLDILRTEHVSSIAAVVCEKTPGCQRTRTVSRSLKPVRAGVWGIERERRARGRQRRETTLEGPESLTREV